MGAGALGSWQVNRSLYLLVSPHHSQRSGLASIVLLSIASATAYGIAAVLQHHATSKEPPSRSVRMGLVISLTRRPGWLIGNALDGLGYLFQFEALRRGSLSLVEPLLVLSLVVALPVGARLERRRSTWPGLASAATIAVGLGLFLGAARPGVGHPSASVAGWIVLSVVVAGFCGGAMVVATRSASRRRASVLLAAGSGAAFGYAAALTERTGHLLNGGVLHALTSWEPYALVLAASAALFLTQAAFHAGALGLSLPTLTVAQPLVAVAIGLLFFGERIDTSGIALGLELLGLAFVVAGVFAIGQTPVIAEMQEIP
jgi:drug/metabolite transporter (DMT)-like permease